MAKSIHIFFVFLLIFSSAFVAYSQEIAGGDSLPCIQKLMPCQPYLKGSSLPVASCCLPLKRLVVDDSQCLCAVFDNLAILKSLNVTQDDALNLAKSCGANADISVCKTAASPSGSASTAAAPSASNDSSTTNAPPKSAGNAMCHVGRALVLATILCYIVSAL